MAKIIIGIHGLANKPPKDMLATWWQQSLSEGLQKNCGVQNAQFEYKMVYWADLLYKNPNHDDEDFSFDALYNDEPYIEAEPGALREYRDSWLDDLRAQSLDVLGSVADFASQYFHFDALENRLLGKIVRDLAFYYDENRQIRNRAGTREMARKVLQDELKTAILEERDKDIMLIAHSMGTIIAYNVLRDLGRSEQNLTIPHLVTIGSPLGLPLVKGRIKRERTYDPDVRTPSIVSERWINFADKKDPVAVDIHLRDDYGPNRHGIRVEDDLIRNDYRSPFSGHPNPHKSYGYLRCPELSKHVNAFLEA